MPEELDPLHIAICDDAPADARRLKRYITKSGVPAQCRIFGSGEAFLVEFRANQYELFFFGHLYGRHPGGGCG